MPEIFAQSQSPKHFKRRLDHLQDIADGKDQFDMVPRKLSRAYIEGRFPEAKYRLLLCFMSHSKSFHVKRSYLESHFSTHTLSRYIPELENEGYIQAESIQLCNGGKAKFYHVRGLEHWDLYRQNVDPIAQQGIEKSKQHTALEQGTYPAVEQGTYPALEQGLKDTNLKESNFKENKEEEKRGDAAIAALDTPKETKKTKPEKTVPTKGNPEHREAVTQMVKDAKNAGLRVDPDSLALTVDTWPLAIVGMLEKGNARPAAAFYNWVRFEMKARDKIQSGKNPQKPVQQRLESEIPLHNPSLQEYDPFAEFEKRKRV